MKQAQLTKIELCKLKAFADHPYKVQDDAEMDALTESIRENGVLAPLLVRPCLLYTSPSPRDTR